MAITHVGSHTINGTNLTSGQFTMPHTVTPAVDDLAICVYACRVPSATKSFTAPGSVTLINGRDDATYGYLWIGYKFLTSTDVSNGYVGSWSAGSSSQATNGEIVSVFRGVDKTTPLDGVGNQNYAGTATTWDPVAVTPTTTGAAVVVAGSAIDDMSGASVSSNYTWVTGTFADNQTDVEYSYYSQTGGTDGSAFVEWRIGLTGGVSENPGTVGTRASSAGNCFTFVLKPSSGGGGTSFVPGALFIGGGFF